MNEELLTQVFFHVKHHKKGLIPWQLRGSPELRFYREMHNFLRIWPVTHSATKATVGRLYIAIDKNLQIKGHNPNNTYLFIDRLTKSNQLSEVSMTYGIENCALKAIKEQLQDFSTDIQKVTEEFIDLKEELAKTKKELNSTNKVLEDTTNKLREAELKCATATCNKVSQLHSRYDAIMNENLKLTEELEDQLQDLHISEDIFSTYEELSDIKQSDPVTETGDSMSCLSLKTRTGAKFVPAIRKLYYSLLAEQIPPGKISTIIKTTLKSFFPNINTDELILPKERCAGYMRIDELSTISQAHKAAIVTENIQDGKRFHMNMDGTTLAQKKVNCVAINDNVISVNELHDGTAESVINDISKELQKLRNVAVALNLPNANSINWTLFSSSSSDSAAPQKRLNKLIEKHKEEDHNQFGQAYSEGLSLVENFCAMHLGCNLRKAFLNGIKHDKQSNASHREHHTVDTLVHEFCKLFGCNGVPEYCCGVLAFPDFLSIMQKDDPYYHSCSNIILDRQVGTRYFVTASNAAKILLLKDAAIQFLNFTGKNCGNKLEKEVYKKLQDSDELVHLKADALMFFHVYADLVMLAKSNVLKKSVIDMNTHYFELQMFLQELTYHPEIIMDKAYNVFKSEHRLYGDNTKTNHRLHSKSKAVHERLFAEDEFDKLMYSIISIGAAAMNEKLQHYAMKQLPGGIYWDPQPHIKIILSEISPSNDICESILGLNDYLNTAIPNMHQQTRSNLTQIKKNKTMEWLQMLPQQKQDEVMNLAYTKRSDVLKERQKEDKRRCELRKEKMIQEHAKLLADKQKTEETLTMLSKIHLITSPEELHKAIKSIDDEYCNKAKKNTKKTKLLRNQIEIRKKVLMQDISIPFSHSKKKRPLSQIIKELADYITSISHKDPSTLVGKQVKHKFKDEDTDEEQWYSGIVIDYNTVTKLHEISYNGEVEHCHFDLMQDLIAGDLIVKV